MLLAADAQRQGNADEARSFYQRVLALRPDSVAAHNNLGNIWAEQRKFSDAINCYRQALMIDPDYAEAASNLAKVCQQAGCLEEAVAAYRQLLRKRPDSFEAWSNLGIALATLCRYDEASTAFQRALKLRSDQPGTYNNLGNVLCAMGLFDEAIGCYHRALVLRPNYPAAHLNLGLILLSQGNFVRGWPEYEWRWRIDDVRARLPFNTPWWDGAPLLGRTILLHNEQGFGDTMQFVRYIPDIRKTGGRIILSCQPALARLMRQIQQIDEIVSPNDPIPRHDVHCPLLTMPGCMGTTIDSIPGKGAYLNADEALAAKWKARLPKDSRLKVGVVWAGQRGSGKGRACSA